jgi:diguanylate cyclase (GGDEF)-like protein
MGRTEAGKKLADEAVDDYERTGATAEIAETLREYALYLEVAGDYKSALALLHREHKLNDEVALLAREKAVLELQGKYESEKRKREIELLNRENDLQAAELRSQQRERLGWWGLAAVLAISFIVVAHLYRELRVANRLLAQKNEALRHQSSRDPLTSLYNRRHFQEYISARSAVPDRRRAAPDNAVQALLLIDIDHFKEINDRYGHAAGDAVLVVVAERLREALRETDMIVRWGGEEFLVFVPATPADRLDEIVMRIMHAIAAEPVTWNGHEMRVTASVGYSPMPLPPEALQLDWDGAIGLVDKALYMAKSSGRNRAYGVSGLRPRAGAARNEFHGDLEQAWRDGVADLKILVGAQTIVPNPKPRPSASVYTH